jgi:hypothetical protein
MEQMLLHTYQFVNKINYASHNELKKILLVHYWIRLEGNINIQLDKYKLFKKYIESINEEQMMNILLTNKLK